MADSNNSGNNSSDNLIWNLLQQYGLSGFFFGLAIRYGVISFSARWPQIILFVALGIVAAALLSETTKEVFQPIFRRLLNGLVSRIEQSITWLTSPFQRNYYHDLIDTHQRYRTQGLDISGAVDLGLEQMFIPLGVVPQAYDQIPPKLIQVAEDAGNFTIWDFITASEEEPSYKRIALIAPPGSGKTILLKHLTLTYAKNEQRNQNRRAPRLIPVLLQLRDIKDEVTRQRPSAANSLVVVLKQHPTIRNHRPPSGWFEKNLKDGKCLVMLDGLDEVPDEQQRQQVSQWIDQQIQTYRHSRFIITSRPLSFQLAPVNEARAYLRVKPFGFDQMEEFVYNWYLQNAVVQVPGVSQAKSISRGMKRATRVKTADLMSRIKNSPSLAELALNPLLLTMITTVDDYSQKELPLHRVELFQEIYDVLLVKRQEVRGIYDEKLANQTKEILQLLALAMMQQKATEIQPASFGTPQFQEEFQQLLGDGKTLKQLLAKTDSASGLLIEVGSDTYAFAHQSIQDYLAVIQIRAKGQDHLILKNLDQQWWHETIHLYAMQLGDATTVVQEAIRRATPETLTLASSLLQDNVPMDEGVRQQLQETLDNDLKHPNPKIAALAAQVKLMSRLRHLHPIDETRAIDLSYVTHAEYQMFLDAQPPDQSLWPDHWNKPHFQPTSALHPIVGLRATDARTFCEWLTQTLPSSNPTVTIRYRFPTEEEAQNHPAQNNPAQNNQVGGWCVGGRQRKSGADIVQGISDRWWEQWERSLSTRVETAIDGDRPLIYQLANNNRLNLSLQFFADQPHVSLDPTLDLGKAVRLVPNPKLVPPSSLISNCASKDQSMQSSLRALEQAVQLLRRKVPNERRLLERQQLNHRSFQEVRAYLLAVMALWDALTVAFDELAEKRRQVKILARLWAYSYERDYRNCKAQRDRALTLYAFFVLMDARRGGTMPAWEGIRLVKETIQN